MKEKKQPQENGDENIEKDPFLPKEDNAPDKSKEYEELWESYLRLQADFDNYKKRSYKEKIEFIKFANEGLIIELLDILDNFERGIRSAEAKKDFDLLHQGVDMISKQLHSLLESKGLIRIKCVGERFDPHRHEAIEVVEGEGKQSDTILDEMQPGYLLNGRIIRTAKVKVLKVKENTQDLKEQPQGRDKKEDQDDNSIEVNDETDDSKDINIDKEG